MTDENELRAAVAAGVVGSEEAFRALLSAIVEVARSIFGAKASSVLLLDEEVPAAAGDRRRRSRERKPPARVSALNPR